MLQTTFSIKEHQICYLDFRRVLEIILGLDICSMWKRSEEGRGRHESPGRGVDSAPRSIISPFLEEIAARSPPRLYRNPYPKIET